MLSIDIEDAKAAGLALLWKNEHKMATENIEKKKWVKNQPWHDAPMPAQIKKKEA